jgi:hypothetical protein
MMRHLAVCGLLVAAVSMTACGGGEAVPEVPVPDSASEAEQAGAVATESVSGPGARDLRWYVSRGRRALDGLENVVVYRSADDVSGSADVVLHARCLGDRTEVEMDMGVQLGDDVVTDGDVRTKRVLVRFAPRDVRPVVFEVGSAGRSLVVDPPLAFLRDLVEADSVVVQTVSRRGTAVFAEFVVTALAYERLSVVSDTCGWILDPVEAVRAETERQEALFEAERAEVLDTYVGVPVRDGIERFGIEHDEIFLDLPAPVERAYLGFGVSVSAVEIALAQGRGIVCVTGAWVGDEIVLRECYIEGEIGVVEDPDVEPQDRGADPVAR